MANRTMHWLRSMHCPSALAWAATYGTPSERVGTTALPFGPEIAASYGKPNNAPAAVYALPFGPAFEATYGTRGERVGTIAQPFGPAWVATYDIRSERVGTAPLPFGPEIAASYGKPNNAPAAVYALPFGPAFAATYGTRGERVGTIALPFGPRWVATYDIRNERVGTMLPFGPEIAANKQGNSAEVSWDSVKPPESYNPAQPEVSWDSVKPPESYNPAQHEASWDSIKPPESYDPVQTGPVGDASYGSWRPPESYNPDQTVAAIRGCLAQGIIELDKCQGGGDSKVANVAGSQGNTADGILKLHRHFELQGSQIAAGNSTVAGAGTVQENIAERSFELQRAHSCCWFETARGENIAERSFELRDQLAQVRAATAVPRKYSRGHHRAT